MISNISFCTNIHVPQKLNPNSFNSFPLWPLSIKWRDGCSSTQNYPGKHPVSPLPDINRGRLWQSATLVSPPLRRRPGSPFPAPVYESSGSALLPAACASCFFLSLGWNKEEWLSCTHNKWKDGWHENKSELTYSYASWLITNWPIILLVYSLSFKQKKDHAHGGGLFFVFSQI